MKYESHTTLTHGPMGASFANDKGRLELKAKMQKAQFNLGIGPTEPVQTTYSES